MPLDKFPESKDVDRGAMAEDTKQKAANIIENKGVTAYGIGSVTASICQSILFDQKNIRPVSHYLEDWDVCLSKAAVLGRRGVERTVELPLSEQEQSALLESAQQLKKVIEDAQKEN